MAPVLKRLQSSYLSCFKQSAWCCSVLRYCFYFELSVPTAYHLPLHPNQLLSFIRKIQVLSKSLWKLLPRTAVLQVVAQCLNVPGPMVWASVGNVILQGSHAQEEVCLCGDAIELKSCICFYRIIWLFRICFYVHTFLASITLAGLNKKDFWFSSKWVAILPSEGSGQFPDRYFLPINTIYHAFFPMRQDTANKTVFVLVVFAAVGVHSLTDFFCSEISIFRYCKMKLAKDSLQSPCKVNRKGIGAISLHESWTLRLQIVFLEINLFF